MKKNKDKRKIIALIGSVLFLILGTGAFLIGAYISKWDVLAWFTTPQALLIYALLSIGLLMGIGIYIKWKLLRGDDYE